MFQIRSISLGVVKLNTFKDGWKPEYVTIEDVNAGKKYKFRHDKSEIDDTFVILSALRK